MTGARILFYPTAIGWLPAEKAEHGAQQQAAWETIQRSHGIANGVYVCAVNRVGHEGDPAGGIEFWGGSFVSDPGGRILVKGGTGEEVLVTSVDLRKVDSSRTHWPFLRDRRIDAYQDITRRYLTSEGEVSVRTFAFTLHLPAAAAPATGCRPSGNPTAAPG